VEPDEYPGILASQIKRNIGHTINKILKKMNKPHKHFFEKFSSHGFLYRFGFLTAIALSLIFAFNLNMDFVNITPSLNGIIPLRVQAAQTGSATITWNANAESDLSGYKIYYGASPRTGSDPKNCALCGYSNILDVGNVLTHTFNNLTAGQTYYFSVSAYDTSNNESFFSPEVNKYISADAFPTPKTGDLNNDNKVDIFDYNLLVGNFGRTGSGIVGDIDNNSRVDIFDYNSLVGNFGR